MISRATALARRPSVSASVLGLLVCFGLALALSASSASAAACANEQLRSESNVDPTTGQPYSTELPDCRAYEMVSPVEKQGHGAGVGVSNNGPNVLPLGIAPEGEPVGWSSEGDFLEPENFGVNRESSINPYLSRRGEKGWSTSSAFPPRSLVDRPLPNGGGLEGDFSLDLTSRQVSCGPSPSGKGERGGEGPSLVCALRKAGGGWEASALFRTVAGNTAAGINQIYLGASADLSRVFFQPEDPLQLEIGEDRTPFGESVGIYEVAGMGTGAQYLRLVNVDNSGGELLTEQGGAGGLEGPLLGAARGDPHVLGSSYHAISESGDVFFTAQPPGGSKTLTLYARIHCVAGPSCTEDGNGEDLETVNVSNPSPSECTETTCPKVCTAAEEAKLGATLAKEECQGLKSATYEGASVNGSKVFFTTRQRLLNGDTYETPDLYEYDFKRKAGENLIQISAGEPNAQPVVGGAEVKGVLRSSSDGSHIYFVADGVLTTEKNDFGEAAVKGDSNLYGYDTVTGKTKFIATSKLAPSAFGVEESKGNATKIEEADLERKLQVTPDGKYLVFSSPVPKLAGNTNKKMK